MKSSTKVIMEFHISRKSRDLYKFDETLFCLSGNVIFTNFHAVRVFAQKMNDKRDLVRFPEKTVRAGHINAMGLIDEILHYVIELYRQDIKDVMANALKWLEEKFGREMVSKTLYRFADEFPPIAVYRNEIDLKTYFNSQTDGIPNRQIILEEMLMLWLENVNPAFSPFNELFDDTTLAKETSYQQMVTSLKEFFNTQPLFGPENQNLIDMLRSPAIAVPYSLFGQLEYIRERWGSFLGKYLYKLLGGLDLIREEEKMRGLGPPLLIPFDATGMEEELERYSMDKDWMPRVVIIAKSTYVWLDQLSKKYQRSITRLDQIPDEELDTLARWGFTGLWLIGLWERSKASQRIKQMCGNPEAVASAYSLFDYQIADELGGEEAFQNLHDRAWKRGIRMAGDMVPNHVGIDGKWVVEHPDWFVSLDYSPFPAYSFNGANLSWDGRVGIYIEDHYYSRNDAAVVFKRVDHWTGSTKYIYHGNDGTSMPWNDTAQLNYLNPEVREAVIQTILHVAKKFPIIRFDAAMTLTKRHFQRLWFPQPGTGGDIPTRSEHGLSKPQFDEAMPEEFWREVVDRVAKEASDTLLLAEAFWLMEGYFVRSLGMHRVYNSAFMNMLKNEDNAKYRSTIKNVMEFDPEILQRFVNFMNNPDEETAVAQFGKDDKYIGVCLMMITMPGLPMFGHGQIEGFTEKYGMEYKKAYWDEQVDHHLVYRHEREIFPLVRKRYLFAHVHNFLLYDFYAPEGHVNEDVFAYSNRVGNERGLVLYHNKFGTAVGWIKNSAAYVEKSADGNRKLMQKNLGEGLGLNYNDQYYCIFKDHVSGLEYIRNSKEMHEKGLYVELGAYKHHVFIDFREVQDNEWHHYANLANYLNGRGVPNIDEALKETFLQPIHYPFKAIVNYANYKYLVDYKLKAKIEPLFKQKLENDIRNLVQEIKNFTQTSTDVEKIIQQMYSEVITILRFKSIEKKIPALKNQNYDLTLKYLQTNLPSDANIWHILLGWWSVHTLGKIVGTTDFEGQSRSWIDEWLFGKVLAGTFKDIGINESDAWHSVNIIKFLTNNQSWYKVETDDIEVKAYKIIEHLLRDDDIQKFLQVNRHQDNLWFNKEAFEQLLWWLLMDAIIIIESDASIKKMKKGELVSECHKVITQLNRIKENSGYKVENLLKIRS